jgi:hypothetical protein
MAELLRREEPHLLGTQEGLDRQLRDIAADLGPRYSWLGTGRAGGRRDESGPADPGRRGGRAVRVAPHRGGRARAGPADSGSTRAEDRLA